MQRVHHGFLVDAQKFAVRRGGGRPHAQSLPSQAAFPEKLSLGQYAKGCLFTCFGHNCESNLAFLDVEDGVCSISLREDCLFLGKDHVLLTFPDHGKEASRVEVAPFFRRCTCGCHKGPFYGATTLP